MYEEVKKIKKARIVKNTFRELSFIIGGMLLYVIAPIFLTKFNDLITMLAVRFPVLFNSFTEQDAFMGLDKLQRLILAFTSFIFINSCVFLITFIFWRWIFNYMTSGALFKDLNNKQWKKPLFALSIYFSLFFLFVETLKAI